MSFPPETDEPVLPESEIMPEEEGPISEGKIIAPVLRERPATLDKVKGSPTIITGLVILIIIVLIFAVRSVGGLLGGGTAKSTVTSVPTHLVTPAAGSTASLPPDQGISFTPRTVSCDAPTVFTMTITLPATLAATDTVVEKLDSKTLASSAVSGLGLTQQADSSWQGNIPSTLASMQSTCANKGINPAGQAILTAGNHTLQLFDSAGSVLVQGSYTVTTGAINYPTPTPIITPSPAAIEGNNKITFAPAALDCGAPAAFAVTITLTSAFSSADVLTENFNGQVISTFVVGEVMNQLNDGSWTTTNTIPQDQVQQICAAGGKYNDVTVFTAGTNDLQLLDSQGKVITENSYTVK